MYCSGEPEDMTRVLGALVARKYAAIGCNVAINYFSNREAAEKLVAQLRKQYKVKTIYIQGVGHVIDVVVSDAGWIKVTVFSDLDAMDDDDWDRCWTTNVKSSLYLFKAALPTFNAKPEGGAFIITSSTAVTCIDSSAVSRLLSLELGLHLMKCLAQNQGSKARVNAMLPGILLTEWGMRFPPEAIEAYKNRVVLKKTADLDDTANAYVMLAQNTSMIGQAIQIGMCSSRYQFLQD
ncbi:putative NADP(+)-dependent dehydrogenase [Aspergillus saccharolyticus JOP 1030-1]|uniref:Putative NADP(+)-dependent dehydrogenase n=1 Tax=Aspergillus saccharolyticus JOP 1030-1 TaxID=1450539 RepID=A0A318ZGH9_9EURO|nr:putative NADP(+)-dependent dehydrogenase [Aspergillus saccharolyticus JOP 1030-1]PYH46105.1 putative NADP(+)-dependent dehydrogenase [Aspergillus saccharolyticus JOP 1030-1]